MAVHRLVVFNFYEPMTSFIFDEAHKFCVTTDDTKANLDMEMSFTTRYRDLFRSLRASGVPHNQVHICVICTLQDPKLAFAIVHYTQPLSKLDYQPLRHEGQCCPLGYVPSSVNIAGSNSMIDLEKSFAECTRAMRLGVNLPWTSLCTHEEVKGVQEEVLLHVWRNMVHTNVIVESFAVRKSKQNNRANGRTSTTPTPAMRSPQSRSHANLSDFEPVAGSVTSPTVARTKVPDADASLSQTTERKSTTTGQNIPVKKRVAFRLDNEPRKPSATPVSKSPTNAVSPITHLQKAADEAATRLNASTVTTGQGFTVSGPGSALHRLADVALGKQMQELQARVVNAYVSV